MPEPDATPDPNRLSLREHRAEILEEIVRDLEHRLGDAAANKEELRDAVLTLVEYLRMMLNGIRSQVEIVEKVLDTVQVGLDKSRD